MQRLLQFSLRPSHTTLAPQGLQKAVTRALELRHPDVLRHLGSSQQNAEFAAVLAALPARQRADVLSLLEPPQRESLLSQLPRRAQKQWRNFSTPAARSGTRTGNWLRGLRQSLWRS